MQEKPTLEVTTELALNVGESGDLEVTITPEELAKYATFQSSDEAVTTVDEKGTVIGVSAGECTITTKIDLPDADKDTEEKTDDSAKKKDSDSSSGS